MRVTLLALQRKVAYEGELGPEILACVDEITLEENPQWWPEEVARQKESIGDDAHAWAEITVEVPDDAIQKALCPNQKAVPVEVLET